MRDFKKGTIFAALLACSLNPEHLAGQHFDPRERFEVPYRVRLSEPVMRSLMTKQVTPKYPEEARKKGVYGLVVLFLSVDEQGRACNTEIISGDPRLATAVVEAMKKIRFRPYYQMGEAVPVEGRISYSF